MVYFVYNVFLLRNQNYILVNWQVTLPFEISRLCLTFLKKLCLLNCAPSCKKLISMNNFSQVLDRTIAQKLHM